MKAHEKSETIAAARTAAAGLVAEHNNVIAHAARSIDVDPSALWQLVRKGKLLPSLAKRMADLDMISLTAVRHRRCAEFDSAARVLLFDAMLADRGLTLTEWMNKELDDYAKNAA